jgi:hypothetical protein
VKKLLLIFFYVLSPAIIFGQLYYPASVPFFASAKIGEHFINTINCVRNPSVLPYLKNIEGAVYSEKKYLTDINLLLISISAPFRNNGASLMFQQFGNTLFSERTVGLSYGKSFGNLNAGLLFESINVKFQGLDAGYSFLQTGLFSTLKVSENVFAGISMKNPRIVIKATETKVHPASSFSLVIGWQSSDIAYVGMESKKEEGRPLSIVFALQYQFADKFHGSFNWHTTGNQPYVSIGWIINRFVLEAGCSYHAALGPSPSVCLIYKKANDQ